VSFAWDTISGTIEGAEAGWDQSSPGYEVFGAIYGAAYGFSGGLINNAVSEWSPPGYDLIDVAGGVEYTMGIWDQGINTYNGWANTACDYWGSQLSDFGDHVGGVALNKSANVLLNINSIQGATYDAATGQILIYGKQDTTPTALPPMNLDDLAVAFRAATKLAMPVVSIEDPVVSNSPEWPGRTCFTVRYGPFSSDPDSQAKTVVDVSSKTDFGWIMYEADRQMKCLGLGIDNRTGTPISSSVGGYSNLLDLAFAYLNTASQVQTRFWFTPKDIEIAPSPDGKSMALQKAEMQLRTQNMFISNGQVESTPDGEAYANWFTQNYDAIAQEQITYDNLNHPHYIYKELKQLAALTGIVKWIQDNRIPIDLSFLANYTPAYFDSAPFTTPQTSVTSTRIVYPHPWQRESVTITITGGVNYCNDLSIGAGGNPSGLAAAALSTRAAETNLAWTFNQSGSNYNVTALSVNRKNKDGGLTHSDVDATLKVNGAVPLTLGRYFDSFNAGQTMFGWGWQAQPYALEFRTARTKFNLCTNTWDGFGEVWFNNRAEHHYYKFVPSGIYLTNDVLHIASHFPAITNILAYNYVNKDTPGQLFTDNQTRMLMRMADGTLLDFSLDGLLLDIQDLNGNTVNYNYDGNNRLVSIGQPGARTISFGYDSLSRATTATLPGSHSLTYSYDGANNLVSAQYDAASGGRVLRYAYNTDHCITQVEDENTNAVKSWSYDVYGRVQNTTQPGVAAPLANNFNLASQQTQVTGPESFSQSLSFDQNYDPVQVVDSRANTTRYARNHNRDIVIETNAVGQVTQYFYDYRGNRTVTVKPSGRADIKYLDINNNPLLTYHVFTDTNFFQNFDVEHVMMYFPYPTTMVDLNQYFYDSKGNLLSSIDANNHTNSFAYDASGNRVKALDGRGFARGFVYDSLSRLTKVTNALGQSVSYTYDERDNRAQTATLAGTVNYTYNAKNQMTSVTTGDVGVRHTTSYTYNARGQIQTVTDPNGFVTVYTYDSRGNLTQIQHDNVVRFTYDYDGLNRLTATHYNGTTGGGKASIVPVLPAGRETIQGAVNITWQAAGDWSTNTNVTIQYSTDGVNWTTIQTVAATNGVYTWQTGLFASKSVQIRFVRPLDASFIASITTPFTVLNAAWYFVNDHSTNGDNYCHVAGRPFNGTSVTGRTADDPVDNIQDVINYYTIVPGATIYVDTGNYPLTYDVTLTEADSGTPGKPVLMTGPTNGGSAVLSYTNAWFNSACITIDNGGSGSNAQYIVVQNLKCSGAQYGIQLLSAQFCTITNNDCYNNGIPVTNTAYGEGFGAGIYVSGSANNIIAGNLCHSNGASGANGAAGQNGTAGRGWGILIDAASSNRVTFNHCYSNSGLGGHPGDTNHQPGYSEGIGIFIEQGAGANHSRGNYLCDNICSNSFTHGANESSAVGGLARSYGIGLLQSEDSYLERNQVSSMVSYGGNSWNGTSGGIGGTAYATGIVGQDEARLILTKNIIHDVWGFAGYGGETSTAAEGNGSAYGVWLVRGTNALVKNNLCFENVGATYQTFGAEQAGYANAWGLYVYNSPNCTLANNTLYDNWSGSLGGSGTYNSGSFQVALSSGSTNALVQNNIAIAARSSSCCISVDITSTNGTVSDFNDLFVTGNAYWFGEWAMSWYTNLTGWQAASQRDPHSLTIDAGFNNISSNIFHLRSDSPLIGQGIKMASVQEDVDGEARPANNPNKAVAGTPDMGYDEFVDTDGDGVSDWIEVNVTRTNPNDTDTDHDGLPDGWEVKYGLDPNNGTGINGANGDPDGDGYSNLQEYQGGSNPLDIASIPIIPPVITSFLPADGNLSVLSDDIVQFSATATNVNHFPIYYAWLLNGVQQSTNTAWAFLTTSSGNGNDPFSKQYSVQLQVRAGTNTVWRPWTVVVIRSQHAPVLLALTNITANVGDTIQLHPTYYDPDNTNNAPAYPYQMVLIYSGWMTNSSKTVTSADNGVNYVTIRVVKNGTPLSTEQTLQVIVNVPLTPGNMAVSPAGTNFGIVMVGTNANATFVVTNTGNGALSNCTATVGSPFSIVSGGAFNLDGLTATNVVVSFTPTADGTFVTNVVFSGNGTNLTNSVNGIGQTPGHILVTSTNWDFGWVAVGSNALQTLVVTNLGGATVTNGVVRTIQPFSMPSGSNFTLGGFGTTNVVVQFAPATAGTFSTNIVFVSGNGGSVTNSVIGRGAIVPVASFSANPTNGTLPLTVIFMDTSSGTITNRIWSFGDGLSNGVTTNVVTHTYLTASTNTVSLTATGPLGTSTMTLATFISAMLPTQTVAILSPMFVSNKMTFSMHTVLGYYYCIQSSTNLITWANVIILYPGTNTLSAYTNNTSDRQRFYKLYAAPATSLPTTFTDSFIRSTLGTNYSVESGPVWRIVGNKLYMNGVTNGVLTYNWPSVSNDGDMQVYLNYTGIPSADAGVGFVFAYENPSNYYIAQHSRAAGKFQIIKVANGTSVVTETYASPVLNFSAHRLSVQWSSNGEIDLLFDGTLVLQVNDPTVNFMGRKVGFYCESGTRQFGGSFILNQR
jgi:YD repeat-containing protein